MLVYLHHRRWLIYAGTEEEYQQNPTLQQQLKDRRFKVSTDEVSPMRTE